jgi:hypothetical protein
LLCAKSFDNEPAILANGAAKRVAVVGDDPRGDDLFGLLERMTFDLDVLSTQGVAGDGGGDLEQDERTELRFEHEVAGR